VGRIPGSGRQGDAGGAQLLTRVDVDPSASCAPKPRPSPSSARELCLPASAKCDCDGFTQSKANKEPIELPEAIPPSLTLGPRVRPAGSRRAKPGALSFTPLSGSDPAGGDEETALLCSSWNIGRLLRKASPQPEIRFPTRELVRRGGPGPSYDDLAAKPSAQRVEPLCHRLSAAITGTWRTRIGR